MGTSIGTSMGTGDARKESDALQQGGLSPGLLSLSLYGANRAGQGTSTRTCPFSQIPQAEWDTDDRRGSRGNCRSRPHRLPRVD